ncbi:MAG: ZIP family metal transporter [Actinomycetota bacterium]
MSRGGGGPAPPLEERTPRDPEVDEAPPSTTPGRRVVAALIPVALLAGMIAAAFALGGRQIFPTNAPPVEELTVEQTTLHPGEITLLVRNPGASPVTIAQVLVDEAYWQHAVEPSRTIRRLRTARITLPYPWVEAEPVEIAIVTATGLTFPHTIEVPTETPSPNVGFLAIFAGLGAVIGVIPVAVGMAWRPLLRTLSERWLHFFLALTAGILVFLGAETLSEALERSAELPGSLGGIGLVTFGALGAFLLVLAGSRAFSGRGRGRERIVVAFAVAAGIGLHNLGEGLAVGAAYRLGEIALGTFLVIGFAIHNITEGIGIVSILGSRRASAATLLALGGIAGAPTIAGGWIGALAFSPLVATVFLAIAAGAIAQVVVDVLRLVRRDAAGGLASPESLLGIAAGLAAMYLTGILVAA